MPISAALQARLEYAKPDYQRGGIINLTGMPGTGKTAFALSAALCSKYTPVYVPMDRKPVGRYIEQMFETGRIVRPKLVFKPSLKNTTVDEAIKSWNAFEKLHLDIYKDPALNPIIWDTSTYAWGLCRLAKLGKLTQVLPHEYQKANGPFEGLLLAGEEAGKLIICIDRMSKEYVKGKDGKESWSGRFERSGYSHMAFVANVILEAFKPTLEEGGGFGIRVLQHKITPELDGEELVQDLSSFPYLAYRTFGEPNGEDLAGYLEG